MPIPLNLKSELLSVHWWQSLAAALVLNQPEPRHIRRTITYGVASVFAGKGHLGSAIPDRVMPYADSEILGLEWFFSQYGVLPQILNDDARWERFAARFRS